MVEEARNGTGVVSPAAITGNVEVPPFRISIHRLCKRRRHVVTKKIATCACPGTSLLHVQVDATAATRTKNRASHKR